jgi:NAD(P)H dehydrogenase (quinone)
MTRGPATPAPLAITGSTGRIGGGVTRRLAARGVPLRLLVRDPGRAPQTPGAQTYQAPYGDPAAVTAALQGTRVAFFVSGAGAADRVAQHRSFVDAAVDAGVEHLVYLSFAGATPDATFLLARDHAATEAYVERSGLRHTFVRDNIYADFLPMLVGEDGVIRGPGGDGRFAAVAQRDVADAVTAILLDPHRHEGRTYTLTGPDAWSLAEAAQILSEETGREVVYREETVEEARASRAGYGAPDWQVEAWISTYTAIAAGELAEVTQDVPLLTGHPATGLREVVRAAG